MGLLDDAIREHLELKRQHGADPSAVERQEHEALGEPGHGEFAAPEGTQPAPSPATDEHPVDAEPEPEAAEEDLWPEEPPPDEVPPGKALEPPPPAEDVLEETPEFLQETPEHDRLWFEQRPPRGFDWDK